MSRYKQGLLVCLAVLLVACGSEKAPSGAGQHTQADAAGPVVALEQPLAEQATTAAAPYAVGSATRFIHDSSRPYDAVAGIETGVRTLITEIWYPVDKSEIGNPSASLRRATYGDYVFGNRDVHRQMMTKTTFFHLTPDSVREGVGPQQIEDAIEELFLRERLSYVDAPLAVGTDAFPVVVMSHGDAGSRYNMESVCEYLAAHGYVVVAPEHTGNSPYAMTGSDPALAADTGDAAFRAAMAGVLPLLDSNGVYGDEAQYGQSYSPLSASSDPAQQIVNLDNSLLQRLGDLRATLKELDGINMEGRFSRRLNLERIGLVGRSFGGATTLMGLAMEPRITAGFAVVPPGWTDQRLAVPPAMLAPPEQESVLLSAQGSSPFTHLSKPTFLLSGAEDALIIGLAAQLANTAGTAAPSADNPHPVLRQAFERAEVPVVWGLLADSNHATLGVSGGYWWPALKPDEQQRVFDPETPFKLLPAEIAHRMQREKALAFFDLTIRGDVTARSRLLDQSYREQGLTLEARNL